MHWGSADGKPSVFKGNTPEIGLRVCNGLNLGGSFGSKADAATLGGKRALGVRRSPARTYQCIVVVASDLEVSHGALSMDATAIGANPRVVRPRLVAYLLSLDMS